MTTLAAFFAWIQERVHRGPVVALAFLVMVSSGAHATNPDPWRQIVDAVTSAIPSQSSMQMPGTQSNNSMPTGQSRTCPNRLTETQFTGFCASCVEFKFRSYCQCNFLCTIATPPLTYVAPAPGFGTSKYWPSQVIEVVRERGCFPSLGGMTLNIPVLPWPTSGSSADFSAFPMQGQKYEGGAGAVYHVHSLPYSVGGTLASVPIYGDTMCWKPMVMGTNMYLSEIDFFWSAPPGLLAAAAMGSSFLPPQASPHKAVAAMLGLLSIAAHGKDVLFPALVADYLVTTNDTVFGATMLGLAASCLVDCAQATAGAPAEYLPHCAGCNNILYPLNGVVPTSGLRAATLIAQRAIASGFYRTLLPWDSGTEGLCKDGRPISTFYKKRDIRLQILDPKQEASNFRVLGAPVTPADEQGRNDPQQTHWSFLMYQKRECCNTPIPPNLYCPGSVTRFDY